MPEGYSLIPKYWPKVGIDLGLDHWLTWTGDGEGNVIGAIVHHRQPRQESGWCMGGISFDVPEALRLDPRPGWTVESWFQLTVSPSLLCRAPIVQGGQCTSAECGDHGFIRESRWVAA